MMKRKTRREQVLTALLALLLVVVSLKPLSASAAGASADNDNISVLSIKVHVDTQTGMVSSELLLKNNGSEDAEVTFALPEISAGIDKKALAVKTAGGEDVAVKDGAVTLAIKAGGNAGLSYAYKTARNLSYQSTIAFDLRQLSKQFNDRIGHLEWTVDMPPYELPLIDDIRPVNYTVSDEQVRVVLENFLVSRFLDRVYITRTTHMDLMSEIEEEEPGPLQTMDRFIAQNYRKWYMDPNIADYFIDNFTEYYVIKNSLLNLYLKQGLNMSASNAKVILEEIELYSSTWSFSGNCTICDEKTLEQYRDLWNAYNEETTAGRLFHALLRSAGRRLSCYMLDYMYGESALSPLACSDEPAVYVVLYTAQPNLAGKQMVAINTPDEGRTYHISPAREMSLLANTVRKTYYGGDASKYRIIYLSESAANDMEAFREYLDALHVKAVVRSQILMKDSEICRSLLQSDDEGGWTWYNAANFGYDGTENYPYETFINDLFESTPKEDREWGLNYSVSPCEEPLKNQLTIPILTMYWGYAYPVEEMVRSVEESNEKKENLMFQTQITGGPLENAFIAEPFQSNTLMDEISGICNIEPLMDMPIPKQMRETRDAALQVVIDGNVELISRARAELNLPEAAEVIEAVLVGPKPTEVPTEAPTEVPTEAPMAAPTEVPTEAPTEVTTETTVPVSTEEKLDNTTQAVEESTLEVSTEEPARGRGEKETKESSDKNVLVIVLIVVGAIVVLAAALTAILVIQKKKKKS